MLKSDRALKAEKFKQLFGGIVLSRSVEIKRRSYVYLSVTVPKKEQFREYKVLFIRNDTVLAEFVRGGRGGGTGGAGELVTKLII